MKCNAIVWIIKFTSKAKGYNLYEISTHEGRKFLADSKIRIPSSYMSKEMIYDRAQKGLHYEVN